MKLRRGFIKEADEYAVEFRTELNLSKESALSPFSLAEHLCIPVHRLSQMHFVPDGARMALLTSVNGEFSAVTIEIEGEKHIIFNDAQHSNRQNSSVMHEIAHVILSHKLTPPLMGDGERNFDSLIEREANELAFTLLVPKPAALYALENYTHYKMAAPHFGVSESLLKYRIDKSGAAGWARNRFLKRSA